MDQFAESYYHTIKVSCLIETPSVTVKLSTYNSSMKAQFITL